MLNTFSLVTPFLKYNPERVVIDNFVFKLHYRWTFIILIVATILVTSRQYIGEHIKCITQTIPENVMNTYCFATTTFTVVRHTNKTDGIFLPGIGPMDTDDEPVKRHAYYQWVPFVLFGQALCFYMPHFLWKSWEGGRIKALTSGLRMVGLTKYLKDKSHMIGKLQIPSLDEADERVSDIRRTMIDRMRLNQTWGAHLVFTELLNLLNLLVQLCWTNRFLGGAFYTLGIEVLQQRRKEEMDYLDIVFPKATKCHFNNYGSSGSVQTHDALCVMALNVINEKVYVILWFWYVFLLIATALGMIGRIFSLFYYKNIIFSRACFYCAKAGKLEERELQAVIKKFNFSNWMFLLFLRSNISEFLFKKVIFNLASEFPEDDPLEFKLLKG